MILSRELTWRVPALALALAALCARGEAQRAPVTPPQPQTNGPLEHPFLLVRATDFARLRNKATLSPFSELAQLAQAYAANESFDPTDSDYDAKTKMTDLCGALALAYVLAPAPELLDKLRETLAHWPAFYLASAPEGSGTLLRWRQASMTQSILALDVMHDDLAPDEVASFERMFDDMVLQWWDNRDQDGTESTPGVVAVWALYRGLDGLAAEATELYLERLLGSLAPSGVYDSGPGYAWARQGGERLAKYAPIDILEFTGARKDLYSDARLRTLHEWMYRGAFTPLRTNLTFGDSDPSRPIEALLGYHQAYRANRFSAAAGRNAAWVVRDVVPRPLLATFVLVNGTIRQPTAPTSALWGDCASFWEQDAAVDSLMGALWNARSSSSHSHSDVNAVHLYAYGENVLRNSGYCGAGVGIDATFDSSWVLDATDSNNTVTIDGAEHRAKSGGGIVEGFTAPRFDYAAGVSGPALQSGVHTRSLLMVHGEPGLPGYFVLLDEVLADNPGAKVNVNLHPESAAVSTLAPLTEFQSSIQRFGLQPVELTLFLGTKPARVELRDGGLCAFDGNEYVGKYLRSTYVSDVEGRRNVVTLAVPHDAEHPKPVLTRLLGPSYSGASLRFPGGISDYVLESSDAAPLSLGPAFFQGTALHCRFATGIRQYFVRAGRILDDGRAQRVGFESDADLSAFVRGTAAYVSSSGATVTFFDPALGGNTFSTPAGAVLGAGAGFVRIALAPGTRGFDLATGALLP